MERPKSDLNTYQRQAIHERGEAYGDDADGLDEPRLRSSRPTPIAMEFTLRPESRGIAPKLKERSKGTKDKDERSKAFMKSIRVRVQLARAM